MSGSTRTKRECEVRSKPLGLLLRGIHSGVPNLLGSLSENVIFFALTRHCLEVKVSKHRNGSGIGILFYPMDGTSPLFKSRAELARLICKRRGLGSEKVVSTSVFLGQVIQDKRPLPEEWKLHVSEVVKRRAHELGVEAYKVSALLKMIGSHTAHANALASLISEQEFARDSIILNARPLELTDAKSERVEAEKLQRLVLEALADGRGYHYCLASQASAHQLWFELLRSAEGVYGQGAAEQVRGWAQRSLLKISVVPESLLLHPTVAYNSVVPDRLKVFVWHAPYDWEHVLEVPTGQAVVWLGKVSSILETESQLVPMPS